MSFSLPKNYIDRLKPEYFPDEDDGVNWQVGVYDLAFNLLNKRSVYGDDIHFLVDVGSGRARKLKRFMHGGLKIIGYDCPETVAWLRVNEPWLDSRPINLERADSPGNLVDAPAGSLFICSDVVEHLIDPSPLLRMLCRLRNDGGTVILSTPDRILCRGVDDKGPPYNKAHVREWTMAEFVLFCESFNLRDGEYSYTQTSDAGPEKHTITAVFS